MLATSYDVIATEETRAQNAFDDVASTVHQSLPRGAALRRTMHALEATWGRGVVGTGTGEEGAGAGAPGLGGMTPVHGAPHGGAGSKGIGKSVGKGSGELSWVVLADGSE